MRPPKGIETTLLQALKFHVVGLIIHGRPDRVHTFYVCTILDSKITPDHMSTNTNTDTSAKIPSTTISSTQVSPHLAGDSALNIECIMRAISAEYKEKGMLSVLHAQVLPSSHSTASIILLVCTCTHTDTFSTLP